MEVKGNRKRDAAQIKRLEISKAVPFNSDSNESIRLQSKKRESLNIRVESRKIIMGRSAIACFARRQEIMR